MSDIQLNDVPSDGITALEFAPADSSLLLVSSWDKSVQLHDVNANSKNFSYSHRGAVLDISFISSTQAYSGGLDRELKGMDLQEGKETILGSHEDAIRCVQYAAETGTIITGSWDKSVRIWDPRASSKEVGMYQQPAKIFSMDVVKEKLVIAMATRSVFIYDIRNMKETLQQRESSLKFMTRTVRCMPSGEGYALSSIEGRIAVEFFDTSVESQQRKYAFKCHREKVDGLDTAYPVNALAFHPVHGTFASGGGDGVVNLWDGFNKKRLKQYAKYPTSIAALAFSPEGKSLAIASSYTYEEGEKDHPPDSIFIKTLSESETRPKVIPS